MTAKHQERLRQIELRELDLLRIIELYLPGEGIMVGLYRALHELRVERGRVKNERSALSAAVKATRSNPRNTLAYALGGIEQIKNLKYKCRTIPRAGPEWLNGLFADQVGER